jgi:hypothetical protein
MGVYDEKFVAPIYLVLGLDIASYGTYVFTFLYSAAWTQHNLRVA